MIGDTRIRRLSLSLDPDEHARVSSVARHAGKPLATVAKQVLLAVIDSQDAQTTAAAAAVISRQRDRIRDLENQVAHLQTEAAERPATSGTMIKRPRWRWPLEVLLADRAWWEEWLPLLGELVGRPIEYALPSVDRGAKVAVDHRGFVDLLSYLFPDITDDQARPIPWHSPAYGKHARRAWEQATVVSPLRQRPVRAEVWEPVLRHIARALTALETTSQNPGDAYTHLRVESEIRGEWMRTLSAIFGEDVDVGCRLPRELLS